MQNTLRSHPPDNIWRLTESQPGIKDICYHIKHCTPRTMLDSWRFDAAEPQWLSFFIPPKHRWWRPAELVSFRGLVGSPRLPWAQGEPRWQAEVKTHTSAANSRAHLWEWQPPSLIVAGNERGGGTGNNEGSCVNCSLSESPASSCYLKLPVNKLQKSPSSAKEKYYYTTLTPQAAAWRPLTWDMPCLLTSA